MAVFASFCMLFSMSIDVVFASPAGEQDNTVQYQEESVSVYDSSTMSRSDFDTKLNQLHQQYPDYSVWNGTFDGGTQCFGFARLMAYNVFG